MNRVRELDSIAVCAAIIDDVGFGVDGRLASSEQSNSILREEMSKVGIEYYDTSHCKVIVYCSSLFTQRTIACAFWPPQTLSQGG